MLRLHIVLLVSNHPQTYVTDYSAHYLETESVHTSVCACVLYSMYHEWRDSDFGFTLAFNHQESAFAMSRDNAATKSCLSSNATTSR